MASWPHSVADDHSECVAMEDRAQQPLRHLWVTDLEQVKFPEEVNMRSNIAFLRSLGARANGDCPFEKVSGFPTLDLLVENPHELIQCAKEDIKMLLWGSPHNCQSSYPGTGSDIALFNANAFGSMAWLAPKGLVIMIAKASYGRPCDHDRTLHVGPVRFANHKTSMSGSTHPVHPESIELASVLIPHGRTRLLHEHVDEKGVLNFGAFVWQYMQNFPGPAIELGCNTASLSMEIAIACVSSGIPLSF